MACGTNRPLVPENYSADDVARLFQLEPLPREGGWFRRTAESDLVLPGDSLPAVFGGPRRAYSVILALITPDGFSALHRLANDEIWCFHAGDSLESLRLHPDGRGERVKLGLDPAAGERPQDVVPAGCWQGTRLRPGGRWALVSCMLAPEFAWSDFELGARDALIARYPSCGDDIRALTREYDQRL